MGTRVRSGTEFDKRAVYFDLDNTLVHRGQSIREYCALFLNDFSELLAPTSLESVWAVILDRDNGGYADPNSAFKTVKENVAYGLRYQLNWLRNIDTQALVDHWSYYLACYSVPMPGAEILVTRLKEMGFFIGVISNGCVQSRQDTIQALPFADAIDQWVSSGEVGIKKPDPAIFNIALARSGLKAEQCYFVGDHPTNDIVGATRIGMTSIWLSGFHSWPEELPPPRWQVDRLPELLKLLLFQPK